MNVGGRAFVPDMPGIREIDPLPERGGKPRRLGLLAFVEPARRALRIRPTDALKEA